MKTYLKKIYSSRKVKFWMSCSKITNKLKSYVKCKGRNQKSRVSRFGYWKNISPNNINKYVRKGTLERESVKEKKLGEMPNGVRPHRHFIN